MERETSFEPATICLGSPDLVSVWHRRGRPGVPGVVMVSREWFEWMLIHGRRWSRVRGWPASKRLPQRGRRVRTRPAPRRPKRRRRPRSRNPRRPDHRDSATSRQAWATLGPVDPWTARAIGTDALDHQREHLTGNVQLRVDLFGPRASAAPRGSVTTGCLPGRDVSTAVAASSFRATRPSGTGIRRH